MRILEKNNICLVIQCQLGYDKILKSISSQASTELDRHLWIAIPIPIWNIIGNVVWRETLSQCKNLKFYSYSFTEKAN